MDGMTGSRLTFRGRALVAGSARGGSLILSEPLSLWGGLDPHSGKITDQRHPSHGETVTGRVLILPAGRGSSSASSILLQAVKEKTAPAAILLSEPDAILALGAVVAREMYAESPPVIVLKPEDYSALCSAVSAETVVTIKENGEIEIEDY